jgi:hypothetical protein
MEARLLCNTQLPEKVMVRFLPKEWQIESKPWTTAVTDLIDEMDWVRSQSWTLIYDDDATIRGSRKPIGVRRRLQRSHCFGFCWSMYAFSLVQSTDAPNHANDNSIHLLRICPNATQLHHTDSSFKTWENHILNRYQSHSRGNGEFQERSWND